MSFLRPGVECLLRQIARVRFLPGEGHREPEEWFVMRVHNRFKPIRGVHDLPHSSHEKGAKTMGRRRKSRTPGDCSEILTGGSGVEVAQAFQPAVSRFSNPR